MEPITLSEQLFNGGARKLNFQMLSENKQIRLFLVIIGVVVLVYALLRLTFFDDDPLLPLLDSVYHAYLLIPEWIANLVFRVSEAGVYISDHQMVFEMQSAYHAKYDEWIDNFPRYMLYKRWSVLILAVIWVNFSPVKRKVLFTFLFFCIHIISVVSGLYLLGVTGPRIIHEDTAFHLTPTLIGNLVMFTFLLVWVFLNKTVIRNTLTKLGIRLELSDRRIHEMLLLLFFFLVLGKVLIPFFAFKPYVIFLLEITRVISSLFGHEGYIAGDQLIGANGALALAKHCLGLNTMYLFAALIFLTRPYKKQAFTWMYLTSGLILIFISNIARLVLVFVVAQGENGFERASRHHEIYNIGIYLVIFGMWVLWVELLRRKQKFSDSI